MSTPLRLTMTHPVSFSNDERAAFYRVIHARRDMRHFLPGTQVPEDTLKRILSAAHAAPSVGLMQPWRFIRIRNPDLREAIARLVEEERLRTAEVLGSRSEEFL
jgi:5,6-dimethylbenzimidazole synthase